MNHQTRQQADRIFDAAIMEFQSRVDSIRDDALFAECLYRITRVTAGLASPEERERKQARVVLQKILRRGEK